MSVQEFLLWFCKICIIIHDIDTLEMNAKDKRNILFFRHLRLSIIAALIFITWLFFSKKKKLRFSLYVAHINKPGGERHGYKTFGDL